MLKKVALLFLVSIFFPSVVFAGKAYYVDCSAASSGDGSYSSPWNNIGSVNNYSFSTGDDVYFKINTTCTPNDKLTIDWDGIPGDNVIIGAYYGIALFGLNGNARPIIDGQQTVPSSTWVGLIHLKAPTGYIKIQDLQVNYSAGDGIRVEDQTNVIITNCYTYRTYRAGITIVGHDILIENNIVQEGSYKRKPGASLQAIGANDEEKTYNVTIRGNKVFHGYEGIGVYKKSHHVVVENNVVYDNRSYHIYVDASKYITIRNNLVYGSSAADSWGGRKTLIATDNEVPRDYCYIGDNKIYGNLLANGSIGIKIVNNYHAQVDSSCDLHNTKIFNNTIVDCSYNFYLRQADEAWSGNEIKNNISSTVTDGESNHILLSDTNVWTWSNNNFDDNPGSPYNINAIIGNPKLTKTSDWRSLTPGSVTGKEFMPGSDSSAKNTGTSLNGYNDRIISCDFTADPITVTIGADGTPDIGAWMAVSDSGGFVLEAPRNLNVMTR